MENGNDRLPTMCGRIFTRGFLVKYSSARSQKMTAVMAIKGSVMEY
jgi:hypothetical protein